MSTVHSRIYKMLADLIPEMAHSHTHYAAPRLASDLAALCTVDEAANGHLRIEIAQDQVRGIERRSSWISFDVDTTQAVARVTDFCDGARYNLATGGRGAAATQVNVYAANWLAVFNSLGRIFQPVDQLAPA